MTIEKLPSGNYRVVQMVNGIRYRSKVVDHEPKEKEAQLLILEALNKKGIHLSNDVPFEQACNLYIESKRSVLSPSTIRGYRCIMRQISPALMNTKLSAINNPLVQTEISVYSKNHSYKSTKNQSGFIMSVIRFFNLNVNAPRILPEEKPEEPPYIPQIIEVQDIYEKLKNSKYEIPLILSGCGLRRSEICALTMDDLNGNILSITKAKVQDENNNWVIKTTKTPKSRRKIKLPDELVEMINERGFYEGHPELLYRTLTKIQKDLGIQHFSLHKMRHFTASYLVYIGVNQKQIQELLGWSNSYIAEGVYEHALEMDEARDKMANMVSGLL